MRFRTEYRIFIESSKVRPKTFSEYISNQIAHGSDINLKMKEVFDMVELLVEAKTELEEKLNNVPNHEDEIKEKLRVYEESLRKEFADSDKKEQDEAKVQIELLDKLIAKFEAKTDSEQSEQNEGV